MLSESRATRGFVRRVHDLTFPAVVSFPMRQCLSYFGAFEDITLPSPHTSDESETFSVVSVSLALMTFLTMTAWYKRTSRLSAAQRSPKSCARCTRIPFRRRTCELTISLVRLWRYRTQRRSRSSSHSQVKSLTSKRRSRCPPASCPKRREFPTSSKAPPSWWRRDDFGNKLHYSTYCLCSPLVSPTAS